jgi:hypothetical protein
LEAGMTTKRDSKRKPKADQAPKVEKEKLKDLAPDRSGRMVKGGMGTKRGCYGQGP